ncbi:uncharacterized protein LOC123527124 isoform X1 [Mercenaria mercenaria]|uniref:uncharacterized protein LOC123527124 isoform X1 n=1 Tax=Mercenaria mercenaria TaxID=6596 RepID=UPI00234FB3D2|nr:uncharacterized protein LOC123527124 isoform X1 [Mercenaria mercenaria]
MRKRFWEKNATHVCCEGKTSRSLYGFNTSAAPIGTRWAWQKNGWMDDNLGERWFNEVFLEFCGSERPELLILDGHSSHETLGILMRAMEENIHILALPPHTTHALQPLDKAVFGPLNRAYNDVCSSFLQESPLNQINKWTFPALFSTSWDEAVTSSNIQSGFRSCGIFPLNRNAIPDQMFGPSEPTDKPLTDIEQTSLSVSDKLDQLKGRKTEKSEVSNSELQLKNQLLDTETSHSLTEEASEEMFTASAIPLPDDSTKTTSDPFLSVAFIETASVSFECITNDNSTRSIRAENDEACADEVLDISDPAQLFQLISDGNIVADPLTDINGDEFFVHSSFCGEASSYPEKKEKSLFEEIKETYVPKPVSIPVKKNKNRKSITHHRLLTSADVINEKLRIENEKT